MFLQCAALTCAEEEGQSKRERKRGRGRESLTLTLPFRGNQLWCYTPSKPHNRWGGHVPGGFDHPSCPDEEEPHMLSEQANQAGKREGERERGCVEEERETDRAPMRGEREREREREMAQAILAQGTC